MFRAEGKACAKVLGQFHMPGKQRSRWTHGQCFLQMIPWKAEGLGEGLTIGRVQGAESKSERARERDINNVFRVARGEAKISQLPSAERQRRAGGGVGLEALRTPITASLLNYRITPQPHSSRMKMQTSINNYLQMLHVRSFS